MVLHYTRPRQSMKGSEEMIAEVALVGKELNACGYRDGRAAVDMSQPCLIPTVSKKPSNTELSIRIANRDGALVLNPLLT